MAANEPADETESVRSARTDQLWADVRIDPVKIALPGGVGYTLRAYRPSTEIAVSEPDPDAEVPMDDFDAAAAAVARRRREDSAPEEKAELDEDELDAEDFDDEDEDELEEDEEEEEDQEQEIPVFLGRGGRLFLFHNPDKLVEFVRSGAEQDLTQLDTWTDLVKRVSTDDIVPLDGDTYELDLVVENLRGGSDAWEPALILKAGEVARDVAYAMRVDSVLVALAAGSPLDDLDEALRGADAGGIGSFLAKRRLRKIPAQQSSLAWRTVIGKISAVADWLD